MGNVKGFVVGSKLKKYDQSFTDFVNARCGEYLTYFVYYRSCSKASYSFRNQMEYDQSRRIISGEQTLIKKGITTKHEDRR